MNININKKQNKNLEKNEVNVFLEYPEEINIDNFIKYIEKYDNQKVLVKQNNEYIYCKTKNREYKVNNSLSKIENEENDFVRISKSCIINMKYLDSFDMGETGIIVVKLKDKTEEIVSRRRVKEILKYIKERSI